MQGDFQALVDIAEYFDHKEPINTIFINRIMKTNEANLAKNIIQENSFFLDHEIVIDSTTTTQQFRDFLHTNKHRIAYSDLTHAFMITPFEQRKTDYHLFALSDVKLKSLEINRSKLLKDKKLKSTPIKGLIQQRDPKSLVYLASLLLQNRNLYDDVDAIADLLRLLTHSNIAVPDDHGKLNYYIEHEYDETSALNLVIYFATHYQEYHWNKEKNYFENSKANIHPTTKENNWFDELSSNNDVVALNSFIQLSQADSDRITTLVEQYKPLLVSTRTNDHVLPTFPYSFIKQLVQLTAYAKKNHIDFKGSPALLADIQLLQSELTFKARRALENRLIDELTLDNITSFEYWCLIEEENGQLRNSTGRILDKFYSKNWEKLLQHPLYLETYVLKSTLYKQLGIVGYGNNYLLKFTGNPNGAKTYLTSLSTEHQTIQKQIEKAIQQCDVPVQYTELTTTEWSGNYQSQPLNFTTSLDSIKKNIKNREAYQKSLILLLSKVHYNQLEEVLLAIKPMTLDPDLLYSFMNRDFGFSFIGNFKQKKVRQDFLKQYMTLSEYQLYHHYLTQAGIDFTAANGQLDFDKIYTILKYDSSDPLVGSNGGTSDNGVYAILKLLELHFQTSLGYPTKLCMSNHMYACSPRKRAVSWMNYLASQDYLKEDHPEPVSFAYSSDS
ncbi:hypothetical protein [Myroides fluvii]|uniref:hypothetical protein n=1 Tax=Myroides fluvii TaxID=2572594 RepID=UPI00131B0FD5|nr:hypothetical protein [Myroides fluvii]